MIHVDVQHAIIDRHRMFPISRKSFCLTIETGNVSAIELQSMKTAYLDILISYIILTY